MKRRILLLLLNIVMIFSVISPATLVLAEESGDALVVRTSEQYGSNANATLSINNGKDIGIDVSQYSGNVDWNVAKDEGVSFTLIRIGYRNYIDASLVKDTSFDINYAASKEAGIKVGVYFSSKAITEDEVVAEAMYISSLLNGLSLDLPIMLARERSGESDRLENAQLDADTETAIVNTFIYSCNSNGYKAGIYAGNNYLNNSVNLDDISSEATIWNADWNSGSSHMLSQYAYTTIPSISSGMIGLNALRMDEIHHFSDPSYEWSEDNTTVTATRTCLDGDEYSELETVEVTSIVKEEATCTMDGIEELTAVFKNEAFETQTKDINIDPLGHFLVEKIETDEDGNEVEYWECKVCGKLFSDEDGENEIGNHANEISLIDEVEEISVEYQAHVQNEGWLTSVKDGETAGTTGKSLRLEALKLQLSGKDTDGSIEYKVHVSDVGWQDWVSNGEEAGTTNQSKQIEAIQVKLTGNITNDYDVYYRVHVGNVGWMNWFKNGDIAGTVNMSAKVEALQIKLVKKDSDEAPVSDLTSQEPVITYRTHIQNTGWKPTTYGGNVSGSTGENKRLEAFRIYISSNLKGSVKYSAHVADIGWQDWKADGALVGTTGKKKQIEAIKICLTEDLASNYDVYYRVHSKDYGWLGWAKNGEIAGTTGLSLRVEALQIQLVKKGGNAPGSTNNAYKYKPNVVYTAHVQNVGWKASVKNGAVAGTTGEGKRLEAIKIQKDNSTILGDVQYQVQLQDLGWQDWKSNGTIAGTTNQARRVETIKIRLTGDLAKHCDIYYRVYVANFGWLGWGKNGEKSGTQGYNYRIEAIQIYLLAKGSSTPGSTKNAFKEYKQIQYTPTYYSQRDGRWSSATYNGYALYSTGCVPTSVAMAVDGILHNGVTPNIAADYLVTTGEFAGRKHGGSGLAIKYGAQHWGLKTTGIDSYNTLANCLSKGYIVAFQVGAGTFTSRGTTHCIILFKNSGGSTYVYDPLNITNGWYSISTIWNQRSTNSYDLTGGYVGYAIYG